MFTVTVIIVHVVTVVGCALPAVGPLWPSYDDDDDGDGDDDDGDDQSKGEQCACHMQGEQH